MTNKISFAFKSLKPLSMNGLYKTVMTKDRYGKTKPRRAKSKKGVDYEKRIKLELLNRRYEINKFETETSVYESFLTSTIVCEVPKSKLVTKKDGGVSKTSIDVDNISKALTDNIFSFFNKLDDSIICSTHVVKRFSPDNNYNIYVEFTRRELIELDDL